MKNKKFVKNLTEKKLKKEVMYYENRKNFIDVNSIYIDASRRNFKSIKKGGLYEKDIFNHMLFYILYVF